jgi:hypothetical protein
MIPLQKLLEAYRQVSQAEREKGTYFEEALIGVVSLDRKVVVH